MNSSKIVGVYLEPDMLALAKRGGFNVINVVEQAIVREGYQLKYMRNSFDERMASAMRREYSLFLMEKPFHARALNLRRSYFYPYWRIERSEKRWEFEVATTPFNPAEIDATLATDWAQKWRKWLFKTPLENTESQKMVYMPLQSQLLVRRRFQAMSPLEMIAQTQARFPDHKLVLGLHPGEKYSAEEQNALDTFANANKNVTVVTGEMLHYLQRCSIVVTQNSSVGLFGMFFHKPLVLFAKIDFHHIAANVTEIGVDAAFDQAMERRDDYDKYLYWFTVKNAIKADAEDAVDQVHRLLKRRGWALP